MDFRMILSGSELAQKIKNKLKKAIKNEIVVLNIILSKSNVPGQIYVKHKVKACEEIGIVCHVHEVDTDIIKVRRKLLELNGEPHHSQIIIQHPLKCKGDVQDVYLSINPKKDVDVFTDYNVGQFIHNTGRFIPPTPHGICLLLKHYKIPVLGKKITIVNDSSIVGRPLAHLLLNQGGTVTICHKNTKLADLHLACKQADILVSAVGIPKFINKNMVKPGQTVIDVGISRVDNKVVGDVDFENVKDIVENISPVPGGVGPMTVAMLLYNTVKASHVKLGNKYELF